MPTRGAATLARTLRDDIEAITGGKPMLWVQVHELGLRHPSAGVAALENALALAIEKGWLAGEGTPPHRVCLAAGLNTLQALS